MLFNKFNILSPQVFNNRDCIDLFQIIPVWENVPVTDISLVVLRQNLVDVMDMGILHKNNPDLKNIVKTILLALVGIILLFPPAVAFQPPTALFETGWGEWVRTYDNDFYNGTYPARYQYSVTIQNSPDDYGAVLGNITYAIDADNIIEYDYMQYAHKNGTSIQWVFPWNFTLPENEYIWSNARTDYIYQRYMPMTVHRWTNRSVFTSDGYQLASFSFSYDNFSTEYENVTVDSIWAEIQTNENENVNATLLPDTITSTMLLAYNPMALNNSHRIEFSNESPLEMNKVYNCSVVIHIHLKNPTGPAIEYYPGFHTALIGGQGGYIDPVPSFNVSSPSSMLPKYERSATGSTNVSNIWNIGLSYGKGVNLREISNTLSVNASQKIGVFRPSTHLFYLDYNGNGAWNGAAVDKSYNFGITGDIPVAGDWNSDGKTEIGVFRNSTHLFYLDYNGNGVWNGASVDRSYNFGITGDIPVSGDWNHDGISEIGVFRNSTHLFYLDYNGNGVWNGAAVDRQYNFGITGDIPVTGDWNTDGRTEIGVFRNSTHLFYLDYNGNGIWNGAAVDKSYNFGITGDIPVSGDWNADGRTEIGVFRSSTHLFYLDYSGNGAWNGASIDRSYNFGITGDKPVTGKWA